MATTYDGGKSYLTTALASMPDIAVNYMFVVEFDVTGSKLPNKEEFANLTVKARSAIIPGRSTEPIESNFMGSKQLYPGKTTYTNEVPIRIEEFQDGGTHALLKGWQDAIYNPITGVRISNYKKDYSARLIVTVIGTDGKVIGEPIVFETAWLKNVGEPALDHDSSDKIVFDATLAFDRWHYASEV